MPHAHLHVEERLQIGLHRHLLDLGAQLQRVRLRAVSPRRAVLRAHPSLRLRTRHRVRVDRLPLRDAGKYRSGARALNGSRTAVRGSGAAGAASGDALTLLGSAWIFTRGRPRAAVPGTCARVSRPLRVACGSVPPCRAQWTDATRRHSSPPCAP